MLVRKDHLHMHHSSAVLSERAIRWLIVALFTLLILSAVLSRPTQSSAPLEPRAPTRQMRN